MLGACMRVKPIDGAPRLKLRRFAYTETRLYPQCRAHLANAVHAGAGGARSRAISYRMSANICRGTATLAIWNVPSQLSGTDAKVAFGA